MTAPTAPRRAGARARLLQAAERLFYADGIRAVGVDRLCADAEVSKRSLYQHFSGKDEVVTEMLRAQGERFAARLVSEGLTPRERVLAVFEQFDENAALPGFRGCPFVGAAVELKDPQHPAAQVARQQKTAMTDWFAATVREGGARDPDLLALELTLVFDGASAYAVVRGGPTSATGSAVRTLLAAHGLDG